MHIEGQPQFDWNNSSTMEYYVRKQLKGKNVLSVEMALRYVNDRIERIQNVPYQQRSRTERLEYHGMLLYQAGLKKRIKFLSVRQNQKNQAAKKLREEQAKTKLMIDMGVVQRLLSENHKQQRKLLEKKIQTDTNQYLMDNQSIEIANKFKSGELDLETLKDKNAVGVNASEGEDLFLALGGEKREQVENVPQDKEFSFDDILSNTTQELSAIRATIRPVFDDVLGDTDIVETKNPKFDLTVENIQKALKDAGLFKKKEN